MKKTILLFFIIFGMPSALMFGQSKIYGEVFSKGKPLSGVRVTIINRNQTIVSDINGVFVLENPPQKYKLQFNFQDYTAISGNLEVGKGNLSAVLNPDNGGLVVTYHSTPSKDQNFHKSELLRLKKEADMHNSKLKQSKIQLMRLNNAERKTDEDLQLMKKKFERKQAGVRERDIRKKQNELKALQQTVKNKKQEETSTLKKLDDVQKQYQQKEITINNIQQELTKAENSRQLKFQVANALIAEKTFYSALEYLPLKMPHQPATKFFHHSELWSKDYSNRSIITFDSIAYWMNKCIITESKMNVHVGFFRCEKGMAVVIFPHVVNEKGQIMNVPMENVIPPSTWTWKEILYRLINRQKGYSRAIIFIFSESTTIFDEEPDLSETSDYMEALHLLPFAKNDSSIYTPRRNLNCTAVVYMFEHLDITQMEPRPITTVGIEEHLGEKNTWLGLHLTKYH